MCACVHLDAAWVDGRLSDVQRSRVGVPETTAPMLVSHCWCVVAPLYVSCAQMLSISGPADCDVARVFHDVDHVPNPSGPSIGILCCPQSNPACGQRGRALEYGGDFPGRNGCHLPLCGELPGRQST